MNKGLLAALAVEVGLITWRDFTTGSDRVAGLPLPADYLAALGLFGAFGLLPGQVGTALGWGFVVATLLNAGPLKALGVPVATGKGSSTTPAGSVPVGNAPRPPGTGPSPRA